MQPPSKKYTKITKTLLVVAGIVSLALGILGMVLPLLPTTPFLLLSAALFLKSSDKLYQWLMNHKIFGAYIRNYQIHKAIPLKTKIFALIALWLTISYSILFVVEIMYVRVLLAAVAIAVSAHIIHFKTLK